MVRPLLFFLTFVLSCQKVPEGIDLQRYKNQFVEGKVVVKEELKKFIPKGDFYLIVAVLKEDSPMPVAVLRVKNPKFPYPFRITGKNKITQDRFIEGRIILKARISKSRGAQTKEGDLIGVLTTRAGTRDNLILIDTLVK